MSDKLAHDVQNLPVRSNGEVERMMVMVMVRVRLREIPKEMASQRVRLRANARRC